MKLKLSFLLMLLSLLSFSQNKVNKKTENSILLKGNIEGSPITLFLENEEIIDCDRYDTFIKGWYYYDKYKIKIPLNGFSKGCDMKLFNYGKNHNTVMKKFSDAVNPSTIDSVYSNSNYEEVLVFDRCIYSDTKITNWKGEFKSKSKTSQIIINSDNIFVGNEYEYFQLPNKKNIDLRKIFTGYGGNKFYSLSQDKKENRLIFYFESESNHNACGQCGASEGEKGYRIIYFDKNWNITQKQEYLTESCLTSIYDTKVVKKTNSEIKYKIVNDNYVNARTPYYLIINKANSTIIKTMK